MEIRELLGAMIDAAVALPPMFGYTGYTAVMKTAVSVPDELFRAADEAAGRLGWSRSQLFSRAVSEFLEREGQDPVTAALDALASESHADDAPRAGRALIDAGQWEW